MADFFRESLSQFSDLPVTTHVIEVLNEADPDDLSSIVAANMRATVFATAALERKLTQLYDAVGTTEVNVDDELRRLLDES